MRNRARMPQAAFEALAAELSGMRLLEEVLRWAHAQRPPRTVADVVVQDEYTHDVVIALEAPLHLVLGTT